MVGLLRRPDAVAYRQSTTHDHEARDGRGNRALSIARKKEPKSQLFIDRHLTFRRDGYSSGGVDHEEVEANQFGAALLMPRSLLQQEVKKNDLDLDDEEAITFRAKRFHVSTAAMSNRLSNLGMLR
jgi:hypothetical protein